MVTVSNVMELFSNPFDLWIMVEDYDGKDKFLVVLCRGPKESYRPLCGSLPVTGGFENVISLVEGLLLRTAEIGAKLFALSDDYMHLSSSPTKKNLDLRRVLNPFTINRIVEDLRKSRVVDTSDYLPESVAA